ncbi:exodeoxyribonuclease VII large subunit [Pseudomonas brenneri]|uniref:exodeoxyribonuclease VII large subunit n=1 Tax=Pseudomonas brenneri TaxID=129817 RepID=UPI003B9E7E51
MSGDQELMPTVSSGEFDSLMAKALERDFKGWKDTGFTVKVVGVLSNLDARRKANDWNKIYGVALDSAGPLVINGSKDVFQPFKDGDLVEVVGYPTINVYRGTVSVQLEVLKAKASEGQEEQANRRVVNANIAALSSLKPTRNLFPLKRVVTIDVIHSSASAAQVDEDFYRGLGDWAGRCNLRSHPVRITSAKEIAEAICSSDADILVIIRGGGPVADFAVFSEHLVLKALAEKKSYRVMGIGHSGNTTLVDLISDFSATVPAEAGTHIRSQLSHLDALLGVSERAIDARDQEITSLALQLERAQSDAKAEIARLHSTFQSQKPQAQPQAQPPAINRWLWVAIAALVVLLFFK